MIRLLPLVLLSNTVNSQVPQYSYRSDIEVAFDVTLLNAINDNGDNIYVLMEFRYTGTIDFNSEYDKNININSQYGSVYYYVNSDLIMQYGFSNSYGFSFSNFELTITCEYSTNITVDFGADTLTTDFNRSFYESYIYDEFNSATYSGTMEETYYIDEGVGTFFTNFLGSQMGYQLSSYTNFNDGYNYGYQEGEKNGYKDGFSDGEKQGYSEGLRDGYSSDEVSFTIFNGILNIAMIPVNVFLGFFNFEILGINMSSFVSALLSVSMVVIIFRFLFNGKSGD